MGLYPGSRFEAEGFMLIERARMFAIGAHTAIGQRRKYTAEPYSVHLEEVSSLVSTVEGVTPDMVAAAWLHDTVEDTDVPLSLIETEFGVSIARLVRELTAVSGPNDGDRATRKALDRAHTAAASAEAHTIKAADLISNLRTVEARDPAFAKIYMAEKALLLEVLVRADAGLCCTVRSILQNYHERHAAHRI
ncbi:(p)ppGpp synthase/HD superfamily hydrolase [Paraburkholderia sp. HC6.4b]|uniref:HD domain-containing protein n=1 Tax=unclassified Paraburkholderia TaxID=2615204 RepID=UPI0016195516|nr:MULTISPECIES: HD domain-containing protein [unclassified Paraburkholderia]MBB5409465.1 (p)ppGpp synthase/HD superfamily hydrolase [Paraburkholderia sp. HC6.4b]MBB5451195.1 (p)ppGpp synthase/HD superfamily hydrolase [Paraburkholderia sp. Kb1A]MBC8726461.1 bifunctional (p)ppGpp synthetase/guanosine-3',5'-bis(diphosphate) 3'-pyrophosphohydrolase [Paraburkholderia sp. 31.1]